MKSYTTGQVAEICGLSRKVVVRLFDQDHINGHQIVSRYQRRTDRRIPVENLIKFMKKHNIPMDKLGNDSAAQKIILCHQIAELKNLLIKSKKRSGVFFGFVGLVDSLLNVIKNLDPLDNTLGASEDRKRAIILRKVAEAMEKHVKLRYRIAVLKVSK